MPPRTASIYLKECLADALIELLKEKPLEKITVDEMVRKAGVGRATYFRSFRAKPEAITFKFIRMWEIWCDEHQVKTRSRFDLNNALSFFEFNASLQEIIETVYQAGLQEAIHAAFCSILLTASSTLDESDLYRENFYAQGLYGLFDVWVRRGFQESPEEMAELLIQIIRLPYVS